MGKTKGAYQEKFPVGSFVRIANREVPQNFFCDWKLHNRLKPEQLEYAGKTAKVRSVGFYHGGDELYEIEGVPGVWHECCLGRVSS